MNNASMGEVDPLAENDTPQGADPITTLNSSPFLGGVVGAILVGVLGYFWLLTAKILGLNDFSQWLISLLLILVGFLYWALHFSHGNMSWLFDPLRENLASGQSPWRIYNRGVNALLRGLGRLYNDALGPGAQQPRWTASAFDRSLLLSLLYPVLAMMLIWTWSGAVDPLGAALGFQGDASAWARWQTLLGFGSAMVCYALFLKADQFWRWILFFASIFFFGSVAVSGVVGAMAGAIMVIITIMTGVALGGSSKGAGAFSVGVAVFSIVLTEASQPEKYFVLAAFAVAIVTIRFGMYLMKSDFVQKGLALTLAFFVVFTSCFILCLPILASAGGMARSYPVLLLLGLFTIVNAVMDWCALGITRQFLYRAKSAPGLGPLLWGMADILASLLLMALLAFALVGTALAFEAIMHWQRLVPPITVRAELASLADPARRAAMEHWWIYVMLLTTQIFSLANVFLGGLCLFRGWPRLNRWLHACLSDPSGISVWQRLGCAIGLTAQYAGAIALALLFYWLLIQFFFGSYGFAGGWLLDGVTALSDAYSHIVAHPPKAR